MGFTGGDAYQSGCSGDRGLGQMSEVLQRVMGTVNVAGLSGGSTGSGSNERNPVMVTSRVFSSLIGHTVEVFCKLEKKGS